MDARERFVRTLTGRDVDRVPFIKVFGGDNAVAAGWEDQHPGIGKRIDELLRFDAPYRGWQQCPLTAVGLCNAGQGELVSEDAEHVVVRYATGQVEVRNKRGDFHCHVLEYPVKTPDDWDRVKQRHLPCPAELDRTPEGWPEAAARFRGRDYALQLTHGGVYGFARRLMGDEALAYAFYDEPGMVADIMNTYTGACIRRWTPLVADVSFDLIETWEDMASNDGCLISPDTFRRFMAPCLRRLREFADAHDVPIILVDSDGYIEDLTPLMLEAGVSAMYPYEVQAGNDALAVLGRHPALGAVGCLDKQCMARGRDAIDEQLERARALIRGGRCIPGPDHFVLSDVRFADYRYFMEGLRDVVMSTRPGS